MTDIIILQFNPPSPPPPYGVGGWVENMLHACKKLATKLSARVWLLSIMWLNAPANHGLARTGKPPQLVNMFPHYLAMSEIPNESTHHVNKHTIFDNGTKK